MLSNKPAPQPPRATTTTTTTVIIIIISKIVHIFLSGIHISNQHINTNCKNQNLMHLIKFHLQFLIVDSDTKVKSNGDTAPPCSKPFQIRNTTFMFTQEYTKGRGTARLQSKQIPNKKKNIILFEYYHVVHLFLLNNVATV
jgi:hypothetical protein